MRLLLALAAGALGYCYYLGREARRRRASGLEEMARWEGEGGNVASAAATQPPAIPEKSAPPPGSTDPMIH